MVFTGEMDAMARNDAEEKAKAAGAKAGLRAPRWKLAPEL